MKTIFNAKFLFFTLLTATIVISLTSSSKGPFKTSSDFVFHLDNEKIMEQIMTAPPSKDTLMMQPGIIVVKVQDNTTSNKASTCITIQNLDNNTSYSTTLLSGEQMIQPVDGGNWAIIASTPGQVTVSVNITEF